MYGSNLRITGLSGIDTEEMIDELMKAERIKVDRVEQDKQLLVWRQELYNSINKEYANFILNTRKTFGLTSVSSTGQYVSNSYENLSWVKKAISSNENIATVNASAKAINGYYNVNVKELAEGVSLASSENITIGNSKKNLVEQFNFDDEDLIKFSINGQIFIFGANDNLENIEENIEDIVYVNKSLSEISLNTVVKTINSADIGVRAIYDPSIDRFFLQTTNTGEEAELVIDVDQDSRGEDFINKLKLQGSFYKEGRDENGDLDGTIEFVENKPYVLGEKLVGKNALIDFNGATDIEMASNQFTINGISFSLNNIGEFNVNVETNVDEFVDKIEEFVEEYNKLVDTTNLLLTQKRYRDYRPLTKAQKNEMDEKDIELWEDKAKSGLLRNDYTISKTMNNIRTWLYRDVEGVSGNFKFITEIGISTEKFSRGSVGGKLEIDEYKLRQAIMEDPDGVLELLFKEANYGHGKLEGVTSFTNDKDLTREQLEAKRNQSGLITRLYDNLIVGMQDIINKSGPGEDASLYRGIKSNMLIEFVTKYGSISELDEDVNTLDDKIEDLNYYLMKKENHYYAKFSAMEKAITRMNQQSMWLAQQFMNY